MFLTVHKIVIAKEESNILYEQLLSNETPGIFSNIDGQIGADQFKLAKDSTINSIKWYGIYCGPDVSPPSTTEFLIVFYHDSKGIPGEQIYQQRISAKASDTGLQIKHSRINKDFYNGRKVYQFLADTLPSLSVKANEGIWISIVESDPATTYPLGTYDYAQWLWCISPSASTDTIAQRGLTSEWKLATIADVYSGNLAFLIMGKVK